MEQELNEPADTGTRGRGTWQTVLGGILAAVSLALLIPGINQTAQAVYMDRDGSFVPGIVLLSLGAAVLLTGLAFLVFGYFRRRAWMTTPRTYANRNDDHTIDAGDRQQNAYAVNNSVHQVNSFNSF